MSQPGEVVHQPDRITSRTLLLIVLTVAVWGALHPLGKIVYREVTPSQFAFQRVLLAFVELLILCVLTGRSTALIGAFRPSVWPWTVGLGLSGFFFSPVLTMTSLDLLPAGASSVLANASPLMVAIASAPLLRERVHGRTIVGIVIGFSGILLIAARGGIGAEPLSPVGVTLSLTGTVAWAAYVLLARRALAGRDTIAMGAASTLVGVVPLAAWMSINDGVQQLLAASWTTHAILVWVGLVSTGMAFTLWAYLLKHVSAARLSVFQYLIPLLALGSAFLLLGEEPTLGVLIGTALVIAGVANASRTGGLSRNPAAPSPVRYAEARR
ncbi:MAG: DMT family transporter [Chloroflexota bacterium]